ncbi:MAG: metallophosphoesterase [Clostridia bacterium]|nr:metallophosphoesterase [Clostridia bacterium]
MRYIKTIALLAAVLLCLSACVSSGISDIHTGSDTHGNTICTSDSGSDGSARPMAPIDMVGKTTVAGTPTYKPTWVYQLDNGIMVREVDIYTGNENDPIEIVQISDLHLSGINEKDIGDAEIMATYNSREWLRDGGGIYYAERVLEYSKDADQIVITGDLMDFFSWGSMEYLKKFVFDKYDNIMACVGNHETAKKMGGRYSKQELITRLDTLQSVWCNDVYYSSKIIDGRVMLIQMDNGSQCDVNGARFWECQIQPLTEDLALARKMGICVLLFYHVPLVTENFSDMLRYEILSGGSASLNFMQNSSLAGGSNADESTLKIYDIITNNGDIIKGAFCGHLHGEYYSEIKAKTADGKDTVIPQYVLMGNPYDEGHMIKITVY